MHPAGIKFGLTQGVLELNGADVVISGRFLEIISELAPRKIRRRKRVMHIWEEVISAGIAQMYESTTAPRQEYVPFFTGLDRIVLESLMPMAEKAKIGHRDGKYFFNDRTFWDRFRKDIRRPHMRNEPSAAWRQHFRECYAAIKQLCAENSPENIRHAELLSLCQINNWNFSRHRLTIEDLLA